MECGFKRLKRTAVTGFPWPLPFQLKFTQLDTFYKQFSSKTLMEETEPVVMVKKKTKKNTENLLSLQQFSSWQICPLRITMLSSKQARVHQKASKSTKLLIITLIDVMQLGVISGVDIEKRENYIPSAILASSANQDSISRHKFFGCFIIRASTSNILLTGSEKANTVNRAKMEF